MAKTSSKIEKLNETGKRESTRRTNKPVADSQPADNRRKVKRRRQIDPTTCEREYSELEIEFMHAMDEYKRASGRMFPTCSEILEVLTNIGYRKTADTQPIFNLNDDSSEATEDFDALEEEQLA
ncbi:MAG: hypothetical protein ACI87E_004406 [Mariniblastus sp.]|jgi:hypothetical protein